MIEKIINQGSYRFVGTISELKRHIGGFKVTKVLADGMIQGINIYSALAEFRYKGQHHRIAITSEFSSDKVLYIEYRGVKK